MKAPRCEQNGFEGQQKRNANLFFHQKSRPVATVVEKCHGKNATKQVSEDGRRKDFVKRQESAMAGFAESRRTTLTMRSMSKTGILPLQVHQTA